MRLIPFLFVLALSPVLAAQDPKDKDDVRKQELARLQGPWEFVELTVTPGKSATKEQIQTYRNAAGFLKGYVVRGKLQMKIAGDRFVFQQDNEPRGGMTFTFDPMQKPKTFDWSEKGKAIYELDGDNFKWAALVRQTRGGFLGIEHADRPTSFDPQKLDDDTALVLFVLKRVKK